MDHLTPIRVLCAKDINSTLPKEGGHPIVPDHSHSPTDHCKGNHVRGSDFGRRQPIAIIGMGILTSPMPFASFVNRK